MKQPHSQIWWQFERIRNFLALRAQGGIVDNGTLDAIQQLAEEGKLLAEESERKQGAGQVQT